MATSSIISNIRIVDSKSIDVFANALTAAASSKKCADKTVKLSAKTKKSYDSFIKSVKK